MSPKKLTIHTWMESYLDSLGFRDLSKVADLVWKCAEPPYHTLRSLDDYDARILRPLAHALVINWAGRNSRSAFSIFAREFGLSSLDEINWLQYFGLDESYCVALKMIKGDTTDERTIDDEINKQRGWGIWMAFTACYDVLHAYLPRKGIISQAHLETVQVILESARALTQNNWRGEFYPDLSPTIKDMLVEESQAIVNEFDNFERTE